MDEGFRIWANPSSPHAAGRKARAALEEARERVKRALGWDGEIIFTSGASEALALAVRHSRAPLAAVAAIEHEAMMRLAKATVLPVNGAGKVEPDACALSGLIAVQQVNNETGVIQSLGEIAEAVRGAGGVLLADCAQGAGKLELPDADLIAMSAHKFGGPVGVGALLVRDFALLDAGGGQERGYRAGTENLPGALGLAAALEAGNAWLDEAARLRSRLEAGIVASGGEVVAAGAPRLATIGAYRMPGVSSAAQLIRFDAAGIAVSAGSACSSGSLRQSHVLTAMGFAGASEVIRISLGHETREGDIDRALGVWRTIAQREIAA